MENEETKCFNCKAIVGQNIYCPECGYPERGTDEEKNKFEYRIKLKADVVEDAQKKIKGVKTLLYVLAGINVLLGVYYILDDIDFAGGISLLISALIFIGCSIWVNKQPLTGILAAFGFYLFLHILSAIFDPSTIFQGFILKFIIIGVFVKGISSAKDAKKYTAQLEEMGVKKNG